MRLLCTATFKLESFFDEGLPPYAILSHTWGAEEVTLQELEQEGSIILLLSAKVRLQNGEPLLDIPTMKKGFLKIVGCALQAEKEGLGYIWCDTCCIDKTNRVELSEAINSMYHWYKESQLCYVYIADVQHTPEREQAFTKSRWFTRGWTLQELIAPKYVAFFDESWQFLGTRSDLTDLICQITSVDREVLAGQDSALFSIAKRMSWASRRETTRLEDSAYCLLGLFGVNMPLIYGEKQRAFLRLQEEIMKISEDQSIFAWKRPVELSQPDNTLCGLLASSPAYFSGSRNFVPFSHHDTQPPFSMSNRGLNISLPILPLTHVPVGKMPNPEVFLATLDVCDTTDGRGPLGVYLLRNKGLYTRCHSQQLIPTSTHGQKALGNVRIERIYVPQGSIGPRATATSVYQLHYSEPESSPQYGVCSTVIRNPRIASWDSKYGILRCARGLGAAISIRRAGGKGLVLLVGIDSHLHIRCAFDEALDIGPLSFSHLRDERPKNNIELARALMAYRSDAPGVPGGYEYWLTNRRKPADVRPDVFANQMQTEVKTERKRHWDQWISQPHPTSANLDLSSLTAVQRPNPKFFQKKTREVWNVLSLQIEAAIEEEIVGGQQMFALHFSVTEKEE